MSRFFRGDSSSESSSDEEEDLYSDDEEVENQPEEESEEDDSEDDDDDDDSDSSSDDGVGKKTGANAFLKDDSDSDSESSGDEAVKVVKSAKNKRFEELEATAKAIENGEKINDWGSISAEFDKLNRQVAKLIQSGTTPKVYVKAIAELEDFMNETLAKQKVTPKKMNATNSRGLNAVKQKIKKNNKDFQKDIDAFRADKDAYMESDDEEIVAPKAKKAKSSSTAQNVASFEEDDEGFATVGKGGRTLQFTPESILKHLRTILESRGKKNTDRSEQIKIMEKLYEVAQTPYQRIRVLLTLISTRFDMSTGSQTFMSQEQWKAAEKEFGNLLSVLETNREFVVVETAEPWEDDEKLPTVTEGEKFKIPGSIVSYVERLDDELTRSLQHIDPHTAEYIERLSDESNLYNNIVRTMLYYEEISKDLNLSEPQRSLKQSCHEKTGTLIKILDENCWKAVPAELDSAITPRGSVQDARTLVSILCNYLYVNTEGEGLTKARAMLCQIYFEALHDNYYNAPKYCSTAPLFKLVSVLSEPVLVYEAQTTLQEICGSGRQKELLAQGVMIQRYNQVTPDQERLEKQRQLPFHMHINLELLECVYLTCSMLLEIPLFAQTGSSPDIKKRVISKTYRRMLEYHERQVFTGPPENTRDHVMQASKALAQGEWKLATEYIHSIKIWELMSKPEEIKAMLSAQIQEEGLRTYLFTYAPYYDTLSVNRLSSMFELSDRKVAAIVSKMISHEELAAALDQVNSSIIFRKGVELSRLQSLALSLSDKASGLIESNERTLETRTQGTANAFERQGGRGGRGAGGTQFTGGALGAAVVGRA
ncbi:hypothetical protein DID88_004816 [Monilinia fructigena]|uniref:Eukaryotic translation initiation factor 3 subunit C n=1 Tax=Monilinia fructigena TaxID=38457 RepID=A0A395IQ79_9HELO|nr:hypothetical protein DID88_004816 [Monilinia fructigena]